MMTNLFESFDPMTNVYYPMNWISLLIIPIMIPLNYWILPSIYSMITTVIYKKIIVEFKLLVKFISLSNMIFFSSIMLMIMISNFFSLFPYIFTPTSHMIYSLSISMSMWLTMMMYGWVKNSKMMFYHMIPIGTPTILMPFMVLIETISNIIRPWTLSIRLTANMIAGHLLMTLIGSTGSMKSIMMIFIPQMLLLILEMSVALIQSYVFTILSILYTSEVTK